MQQPSLRAADALIVSAGLPSIIYNTRSDPTYKTFGYQKSESKHHHSLL